MTAFDAYQNRNNGTAVLGSDRRNLVDAHE